MDAFERAKLKFQKNREREARTEARRNDPEKKEPEAIPVVPKTAHKPAPKEIMRVTVDGPVPMVFEVWYGGNLLSGQLNREYLSSVFKKQLSVMGRVNDVS